MSAGDSASWTSATVAAIAFIVSVFAAGISWKSLHWERDSAESARRSAEAAERTNLLTERALMLGRPLAQESDQTGVTWEIEHATNARYVLRNTGTETAEHVSIDRELIGGVITRSLPTDAVIHSGEGVDFLMKGSWQKPLPNQIYVQWGGPEDVQRAAVPLRSVQ
ncbi:hypothetical protein ABQE45_03425 [Mycobacteroides chelonae]